MAHQEVLFTSLSTSPRARRVRNRSPGLHLARVAQHRAVRAVGNAVAATEHRRRIEAGEAGLQASELRLAGAQPVQEREAQAGGKLAYEAAVGAQPLARMHQPPRARVHACAA